ncbi:MAG: radical SAM protein [Candidatus Omnitrophica bacterium]|nr:radical SAM protein [Candidatus Omnitrophota bacterium]MBU3934037.1 radical SAM protein [Candidatus Omnitrophota bacterium]
MKIALVSPPLYGVDMPPLGIAYIAAKLIEDSFDVKVFCFNSQLYQENETKRFLWEWDNSNEWCDAVKLKKYFDIGQLIERWANQILEINPKIIGFGVNSHSRILANLLADRIREKRKDVYIIFGGPWCTELTQETGLNRNVDIYVRGEGEEIASKIVKKILDNESIRDLNIEGTIINTGGSFKDNRWNKEPLGIDRIPFPALNLFNFDNYTNKQEIPIIFSRGCNYCCSFCTDKPMWGNYRMRKADNIIEEMVKHSNIFGRNRFKCNDLLINGDIHGLRQLAQSIIQRGLNFQWGGMARARPEMAQETFKELKKAGCFYLTYGVESGAARVLSHMCKPNKKHVAQALNMTTRAKIKANTLWMAGYPVERWVDVAETMLFLLMHKRDIGEFVSISCCYIPRQSPLHKQRELLNIKYNANSEWYIENMNTPSIRKRRRKMLLSFAKTLRLYRTGITQ